MWIIRKQISTSKSHIALRSAILEVLSMKEDNLILVSQWSVLDHWHPIPFYGRELRAAGNGKSEKRNKVGNYFNPFLFLHTVHILPAGQMHGLPFVASKILPIIWIHHIFVLLLQWTTWFLFLRTNYAVCVMMTMMFRYFESVALSVD